MGRERGVPEPGESWYRRAGRQLDAVGPLVADTLLALVLAVPLLADLNEFHAPGPPLPFRDTDLMGFVLVALLVVPLALRRRYPTAVFCVILAAAVATTVEAYRPASYGFGLIVATYTVARWCDRRRALAALAAALSFSVFVKVRFIAAGVDIELFEWPLDVAYMAGAWFLGDSIRTRARQAAELERNREALAQQAVEHEQLRIARDLHDSIGHWLSVMVLYAEAAKRELDARPACAREHLETVATSGRDALAEMDRLVRVLRHEDLSSVGVSDLDKLADEFRGLGLPVVVTVTGDPRELPDAVVLSAYRIAQEALTNTLKHAGAGSAEVHVDYDADALTVTVADDGSGCPELDTRRAGRHGLTGMRERATNVGGELEVRNGPDGSGFVVSVRLPAVSEHSS